MMMNSLPPDPLSPNYAAAPLEPWEEKFTAFEFKAYRAGAHLLPYRFYRPPSLEPGRIYPLVLFFHGAGERGVDNRIQLLRFASVTNFWEKFPCFIIAPQCPPPKVGHALWVQTDFGGLGHTMKISPPWPMELAMDLLGNILMEQPVDPSRVYVIGHSMGGFATWDILQRKPDNFAAAVPICGGADLAYAPRLSKIPVWVFHGDADLTVPPKRSRDIVAALIAAGGRPNYTEYLGVGHDAWRKTYANMAVWDWLFTNRRQYNLEVRSFGSYRALTCPGSVDKLIISIAGIGNPEKGTMAYEWKGTFAALERQEHIIYLQDTARSWFNDPEGYENLISYVQQYQTENKIKRTTAIGLSMGGTEAIFLANKIKIDRVVSLSPQILVGAEAAPWDTRYLALWNNIREINKKDVSVYLDGKSEYVLIITIDNLFDIKQVSSVIKENRNKNNLKIICVRGDHNIGSEFKKFNLLNKFVARCIDGEVEVDGKVFFNPTDELLEIVDISLTGKALNGPARIFDVIDRSGSPLPWPMYEDYMKGLQFSLEQTAQSFGDFVSHYIRIVSPVQGLDIKGHAGILRYGWEAPNSGGVWSIGRMHAIVCRLLDFETVHSVQMHLRLGALVAESHKVQRIEILSADGYRASRQIEWDGAGLGDVEVSIPITNANVDIILRTPDCISPNELNMNSDRRLLGVYLRKLWFSAKIKWGEPSCKHE